MAGKRVVAPPVDEAMDEVTRQIHQLDRYGRHEASIVRVLAVILLELRKLREAVEKRG
jgi:hypothetical protein